MIKVKNPNNAVPISRMSIVIQNGHMMKASPWLLQLSACCLLNAFPVSNSLSTTWWTGHIFCSVMSHAFRMYQITGKDACCQQSLLVWAINAS